jgi:ABC-type molybdate transport system substrate-binding protein
MAENRTIRILSAGAVKQGLRKCAELYSAEAGVGHEIEFATGPVIKERVVVGEANADIVALPRHQFDDLIVANRIRADDVAVLGSVTVGATVKNGTREPDLSSVDGFVASVLGADRVIYNLASSGQYVAMVLEGLGLTDQVKDRTSIFPDGRSTMEALAADTTGNAIGFGHATEIRLHDYLGTHLVGPLPDEIGRETPYAAGRLAEAGEATQGLVDFMVSARGRQVFLDSGVLPAS